MKTKSSIFEELMSGIENMNQHHISKIVPMRNKPRKLTLTDENSFSKIRLVESKKISLRYHFSSI